LPQHNSVNEKKVKEYIRNSNTTTVQTKHILMTEKIHINEFKDKRLSFASEINATAYVNNKIIITPTLLKPNPGARLDPLLNEIQYYSLVSGYKPLFIANALKQKWVTTVITRYTRNEWVRNLGFVRSTAVYLPTKLLKIPDMFRKDITSIKKIDARIIYYKKNGRFKDTVIIDKNKTISDGYAAYQAAVILGHPWVLVQYLI